MPSLSQNSTGGSKTAGVTGLEQALRDGNTAIIGDTLHFETLGVHDLDGTSVSPANIVDSVTKSTDMYYHVWAAAKQTIEERIDRRIPENDLTKAALERLLFELGNIILDRVNGPHFTFVDPRRHSSTSGIIKNARRLICLFEERGVRRSKVVISIPATHEGVAAAQELEDKHRIHTNLYLVSGLLHAATCAEAGATAITIPVGRLLHWHERKRKTVYEDLNAHPGIEAIQSTLEYFRLHKIRSKVIGSEFRALSEIGPLGDFDAICVTKDQVDRLRWNQVPISKPLATSPASLRARQAQYPSTLLASGSGFLNAMSAETRNMVATTLYTALGEMKVQMDNLEEIVRLEVARQFGLQTMDLKALYRSLRSESPDERRGSADLVPKIDYTPRRALARALDLDGPSIMYDEDEIF